ncbi:sensor histidine kinase [Sphingomonas sp.]|uniref:sensor histidine kinase n=1 Tax=Sphingomonas sp. TaxID=28214 RepID=UPI0035B33D06
MMGPGGDFAGQGVAHAVIDADGVLVSAEPAIDALNRRAGGALGEPLAVPQMATVVRLARRLGIVVSRSVTVADEDADITLWLRAQPEDGRVRLAASGWHEQRPWRPAPDSEVHAARAEADWRWETDAGLRLTFLSLDAGPRYGFDALALLGQPLTALFTLEADGQGDLPILGALARRRPLDGQRARLKASARGVRLSAAIHRDGQGMFAGFIGTARMDDEGGDAGDPPVDSAALTATFTAGLDRALRTPLARIVASADSIQAQADGPVPHDYTDYAADIATAGRHLLGLVDHLVELQAIERPDFALRPEPIDLADVARRAAGLLAVRADSAGVRIVRPGFEASGPAWGDFGRVLQILLNLIGNALRYSPHGEAVTVSVAPGEDCVCARVTDRGKGIAPADQTRIFEKFERVDPSEPGGNGLGLYIARRLARAMGGDLTVESVVGEGATFTLSLPGR